MVTAKSYDIPASRYTADTIARMYELREAGKWKDPQAAARLYLEARRIVASCPARDHECEARTLLAYVREHIPFRNDTRGVEVLMSPDIQSRAIDEGWGGGDCDDQSVYLSTLAEHLGLATRFVTVAERMPGQWSHVYAQVYVPGRGWMGADTVAGGPLGWEPQGVVDKKIWPEPETSRRGVGMLRPPISPNAIQVVFRAGLPFGLARSAIARVASKWGLQALSGTATVSPRHAQFTVFYRVRPRAGESGSDYLSRMGAIIHDLSSLTAVASATAHYRSVEPMATLQGFGSWDGLGQADAQATVSPTIDISDPWWKRWYVLAGVSLGAYLLLSRRRRRRA